MLIAMVAMTLMTFIAMEVSYDTSVDYIVAAQQVNRVRAYYAAKSGIEISLLRIMLYKQVMAQFGSSLGSNASMLDPIWSFPFMWPPTAAMAGAKMDEVDKDMMKEAVDDSLMKNVTYTTTIGPESGKIDINALGSNVTALREAIKQQVMNIFDAEVKNNEAFGHKYAGYNFLELVNNISDYIDDDTQSQNGGDESNYYRDIDEKDIQMPPNRPLRTLDELHQVAGMNDDFYKLLAPRVTVFGAMGINVNYCSKDLIMGLDPNMSADAASEMADKVIARRTDIKLGGPFKDDNDFFGFIQGYGANVKAIQDSKIPLLYGMEFNFRVVSTGFAANVKREITVVTYDFANMAPRLANLLTQQDQSAAGGGVGPGTPSPAGASGGAASNQIQVAKGRPTVVYWEEN